MTAFHTVGLLEVVYLICLFVYLKNYLVQNVTQGWGESLRGPAKVVNQGRRVFLF